MEYFRIGRIVNTFGIRGEIKVIADTDFPEERFAAGEVLTILDNDRPVQKVTVKNAKLSKGTYIVSFEEFNNINDVEKFKTMWLAINQDQQQELDEHEFYFHEIIGLKVITIEKEELGVIKDILSLGSNDVWVIKRNKSKLPDALIPYIGDVVKEVNVDEGYVVIELMEGLIDDEN
ncbi:MAG: ribosome maturation factor RimM [Ruoffia tabacinasalis]|uniref:ribosome maturation factor RimM n=1 Tax=unclassified Ruoffia TaxID=2862149 RepID=UPI000EE6494E|nr:ribosome maturation factor RimM [Aerococcaceae bacterium]